ncbi:unnamed protein product [Mytilus coruscus]|uniref:Reverse transcriptase domain-containing protein n=1 Tax=Mytilus coruscus TaxID=42192 RepID=A0A6J8CHU7_MYTCO|nr:unnamed protein product [Mytilus coruscus]
MQLQAVTWGATLGTICVASPTCADDITLLGEPQDIQAMLNIIKFHTKRDMVKINPEKSEVLCSSKGKNYQQKTYTLGEKQINRVDKLKHLGITRNDKSKVNTDEECLTKTTIKYLSIQENPTENPHNIWKCVRNNQNDIRKADVKSRLITGTYMLQTTKGKFSKNQRSGICELCTKVEEDIKHFLLECQSLESVREKQRNKLLSLTVLNRRGGKANYKQEYVLQIIMDCSKLSTTTLSHLKTDDLIEIEKHSQNVCHQMHKKRTELQAQ